MNTTTNSNVKKLFENSTEETQTQPEKETTNYQPRRPRSMTTLKLQWLAERVRKARDIKEAVERGTYHVESRDVARALLNVDLDRIKEEINE